MENEKDTTVGDLGLAKAMLAGAIGGLAGAAAKQLCEAIAPPRTPDREPPPAVLADKIVRGLGGDALSDDRKRRTSLAVHWIFSTLTSAAYGAFFARNGRASARSGLTFGLAVWAGLHEVTLPLLGATPPLPQVPLKEQANEFVTHSIFGIVVENVRAAVVRAM